MAVVLVFANFSASVMRRWSLSYAIKIIVCTPGRRCGAGQQTNSCQEPPLFTRPSADDDAGAQVLHRCCFTDWLRRVRLHPEAVCISHEMVRQHGGSGKFKADEYNKSMMRAESALVRGLLAASSRQHTSSAHPVTMVVQKLAECDLLQWACLVETQ
jgi:hypothetical protein